MSVWNEIAELLDGRVQRKVERAHPKRYKVRRVDPLVVDELDGDLALEEGDPDVEIVGARAGIAAGDLVAVMEDAQGDYIVMLGGGDG